jgi:methylmalonyl-CoA/ethylmalonyl-CoA epimerase
MEFEGTEVVEEQKVKVAFFVVGESRIELLEPTSNDSPVAKFLEKNGPGVHHVAYEVADLQERLVQLKAEGVRLIDETPLRPRVPAPIKRK